MPCMFNPPGWVSYVLYSPLIQFIRAGSNTMHFRTANVPQQGLCHVIDIWFADVIQLLRFATSINRMMYCLWNEKTVYNTGVSAENADAFRSSSWTIPRLPLERRCFNKQIAGCSFFWLIWAVSWIFFVHSRAFLLEHSMVWSVLITLFVHPSPQGSCWWVSYGYHVMRKNRVAQTRRVHWWWSHQPFSFRFHRSRFSSLWRVNDRATNDNSYCCLFSQRCTSSLISISLMKAVVFAQVWKTYGDMTRKAQVCSKFTCSTTSYNKPILTPTPSHVLYSSARAFELNSNVSPVECVSSESVKSMVASLFACGIFGSKEYRCMCEFRPCEQFVSSLAYNYLSRLLQVWLSMWMIFLFAKRWFHTATS